MKDLWPALLIGAPMVAAILWFGWKKWKASAETAKLDRELKREKAKLDNPEMDEDFAHQLAAGPEAVPQRARDQGAV